MIFDAIILAGARSERLNGADKGAVVVGGRTLLERAACAVAAAQRTIVVGPRREMSVDVDWIEEPHPGGGPGGALAEGLKYVQSEVVVVLAVDYPLITSAEVDQLMASIRRDGAVAVDNAGRQQPLLGAYRTRALETATARFPSLRDSRVSDLFASLDLASVEIGDRAHDCDTWEEIARLETLGS